MKFKRQAVMVAVCLLVLSVASAEAGWMGWKGESEAYRVPCQRMYNGKSMVSIEGNVEKIEHATPIWGPIKGQSYAIHLLVRTDRGLKAVHVGPGWYFDRHKISYAQNDHIKVTGSAVVFEGDDLIIAKEITRDNEVLKIRDDTGCPMWARPDYQ